MVTRDSLNQVVEKHLGDDKIENFGKEIEEMKDIEFITKSTMEIEKGDVGKRLDEDLEEGKVIHEEDKKSEEVKMKDEDENENKKRENITKEEDVMVKHVEDVKIVENDEEKKVVPGEKPKEIGQKSSEVQSEYEKLAKEAREAPSVITQTLIFLIKQKITILNIHYDMTIFLSNDKEGNDRIAEGKKKKEGRSIFLIEVGKKGFMIKNKKSNEYLFVTKNYRFFGNRIVEGSTNLNNRCYFDILLMKNGYVIRNKETDEFLFLNDREWGGDKVLSSNPKLTERSFFNLVKD